MKSTDKKNSLNQIIMRIASQFINIPFEQFSQKVQEALALIGSYLDVDRAYVFEYDFTRNIADNTYEWCHDGVEPQKDYLTNYPIDDMLSDWVMLHKKGLEVVHEDIQLLDQESNVYQTLAPQGIKSICTIPLMIQEECFGFVGFDDIRQKRRWKKIEFNLLRILSELIVNAIYKHKNDELLVELKKVAENASIAKGNFLAQMSHEIRTPLNGIYNAVYLLKKTDYTKEQEKYLNIAQSSLDILSSVINDILDMSKIEAGKMDVKKRPVNLESELTKTLKILRPSILSKNIQCIFDFDYQFDFQIICDIDKINQIVLNFANNAIKYTEKGYIKTKIRIQDQEGNLFLSICVEDTGKGISKEEQNHVFDEFFQAKNRGNVQGTGLGLSIVYQLIHLMGGTLEVNSELNKGSTFQAIIPVSRGEVISFKQPSHQKVLLISHDQSHFPIYKNLLESMFNCVDTDVMSSHSTYEIIVIDDFALQDEKIVSIINSHRQNDTIVWLFTKSSIESDIVDYAFDIPISRSTIIQHLKMHHEFSDIDHQQDTTYQGHILVVDDNIINQEAMMTILKKRGFLCDSAISGSEAIEMVKKNTYDMIMMDIQMPEMNGYEASKIIREISDKHIPIIVVTANAFLSDYDKKMSSYIDDVIYKPLNMDTLEKIIVKHLMLKSSDYVPYDLSVLSKDIFYEMFELNIKSGVKMALKFMDDYENEMNKLMIMISNRDYDGAFKQLHYLKGPLSYLGAERLIYHINVLMNEFKNQSSVHLNKIDQFKNEGLTFIEVLRDFISDLSKDKP